MELQILVLIGLFIILVLLNINTRKLLGGDNHDDDVTVEDTDTDTDTDTTSENKKGFCSLEEIKKHNNPNDKTIYHNGVIYNLNSLIKKIYVPQIADPLVQENFNYLITIFEKTDLQDFSKISKSIKDYNKFIIKFLIEDTATDIIPFAGTEKQFNYFINTFLSIININAIRYNIICPAGLSL